MPNTTALDFQRGDVQMTAGLHNERCKLSFLYKNDESRASGKVEH